MPETEAIVPYQSAPVLPERPDWNNPVYYHGLIYQPDCHLCPLRGQTMVLPDGPIPARRVFVGENPGPKELIQGRGFVGPSGKLLWHLDAAMGNPPREEYTWVSNASLCTPTRIRLSTGAVLSKAEAQALAVQACRRRLLWEIRYVTQDWDGAVIQPLGNWALWSLTGLENPKIYSYRGSVMMTDLKELCNHTDQAVAQSLIDKASKRK